MVKMERQDHNPRRGLDQRNAMQRNAMHCNSLWLRGQFALRDKALARVGLGWAWLDCTRAGSLAWFCRCLHITLQPHWKPAHAALLPFDSAVPGPQSPVQTAQS